MVAAVESERQRTTVQNNVAQVERERTERERNRPAVNNAPLAPREPGVQERSAEVPAATPTHTTAMDARARARGDAQTRLRERVAQKAAPTRTRATPSPLEGRHQREARRTLSGERAPNARDPYVQHQSRIREQLRVNGALHPPNSRVHIDDVDRDHGRSVARTAAGRTSLVPGGDVSINTNGLPAGFQSRHLTPAEQARFNGFEARAERLTRGNPSVQDYARVGADSMVQSVREKQLRLENIRNNVPNDGRPTFVNMSWGQTGHEAAQNVLGAISMSPENSAARREVRNFLGGREPQNQQDVDRVMRGLIYPQLQRAMQTPEHRAEMGAARAGLEAEVARGRQANMLVFQSAANSFEDASRLGNSAFSASSTSGIRGMITVGSVDINGPGTRDDRVSSFSSSGQIDISAPGSRIPVGQERGRTTHVDGTSFSSPYMADVARAMHSANPRLRADDIARLLADPRASNNIPGTVRDGRGHVDPFAAVMIARDPTITREQIEAARRRVR